MSILTNTLNYFRFKRLVPELQKDVDVIRARMSRLILSDRERHLLCKAHTKGKDRALAVSWGWTDDGDHFHKKDGTVVKRTDYIGKWN